MLMNFMSRGGTEMEVSGFRERWQRLRLAHFFRRSAKRRAEEASRQWFLLLAKRDQGDTSVPQVKSMRVLLPPEDRFWADPFLWCQDDRRHVFFEEYPYSLGLGRISVMELDSDGCPVAPPEVVLEMQHHLSYPYLFSFDGELYMVPEQRAARCVDIYRCISYPTEFERVRTLFKGVRMVDVTVFEHEGLWWLFCAIKTKGLRYDENLCAFYSNHPVNGPWVPHPLNPLVKDLRRARPGGRVFRDEKGRLIRPSQDCYPNYGAGLNLSVIEELTVNTYREMLLWRLSGQDAGGWRGLHHMDMGGGFIVMDAEREIDISGSFQS